MGERRRMDAIWKARGRREHCPVRNGQVRDREANEDFRQQEPPQDHSEEGDLENGREEMHERKVRKLVRKDPKKGADEFSQNVKMLLITTCLLVVGMVLYLCCKK